VRFPPFLAERLFLDLLDLLDLLELLDLLDLLELLELLELLDLLVAAKSGPRCLFKNARSISGS
jgi:hypothetical protein